MRVLLIIVIHLRHALFVNHSPRSAAYATSNVLTFGSASTLFIPHFIAVPDILGLNPVIYAPTITLEPLFYLSEYLEDIPASWVRLRTLVFGVIVSDFYF